MAERLHVPRELGDLEAPLARCCLGRARVVIEAKDELVVLALLAREAHLRRNWVRRNRTLVKTGGSQEITGDHGRLWEDSGGVAEGIAPCGPRR